MVKYWVVGATWGSQNDQTEVFLRRGYWRLGHDDEDAPDQASRRDEIREDDRIAVKRMLGQGSQEIEIRAIGIVKEVDRDDKTVYVNWIVKGLKRTVKSRGYYKSVHGPFDEVFRV